MKRRSFQLSHEIFWKLESVRSFQSHDNVSETVRFCIDYTHAAICVGPANEKPDGLSGLVEKNNLMLRFILIELVKMHEGQVKPLSDTSRQYLKELKQQMQDYLESQS